MNHLKKKLSLLLSACLFICCVFADCSVARAETVYQHLIVSISADDLTMYTGQLDSLSINTIIYSWTGASIDCDSDYDSIKKAEEEVLSNLIWTSSDASVLQFVSDHVYDELGNLSEYVTVKKLTSSNYKLSDKLSQVQLMAMSEGTATVTVKSKLMNQSMKCKVTVKNTELAPDNPVFYVGNSYTFSMRGNADAVSFSSSDAAIAAIDASTGVMKTKKAGKATISCLADDGSTYKYKVNVKKKGLSYTKLTTYYYEESRKFPLVAAGIDVKSWKSSNKKVCTVVNNGTIGTLKTQGTGTCTITCTAKDGKKYTCKLTVAGGKPWGGLKGGYRPTLSTVKKHGYFNDINTIKDYGTAIVTIIERDHEFSLGNGNTPLTHADCDSTEKTLKQRFPDKTIKCAVSDSSDYMLFTNNSGTKSGRIYVSCYYVE